MSALPTNSLSDDELCPNCGKWVAELTILGWCSQCSPELPRDALQQVENFLAENADHLEYYTGQGLSTGEAIDALRSDVRPRCLCCGGVINRAPRRNVLLCRKTRECRRLSRRYVYLYREKGFTKIEALVQIFQELG